MKTVLMAVALAMLTLQSSSALAQHEARGAGVVKKNGETDPADFYYQPKGYKIPEDHLKFDIKSYPGLEDEMKKLLDLVQTRARLVPFEWHWPAKPEDYEFFGIDLYTTEALSCDDRVEDVQEEQTPVGCSFVYEEEKLDLSIIKHKVAELKDSVFRPMKARKQALILLHELLHHRWRQETAASGGSHKRISTFIKILRIVLPVLDREEGGTPTLVTDQEKEALAAMQTLLGAEGLVNINRNGGGVIFYNTTTFSCPESVQGSNFVDVYSSIHFDQPCAYNGGFVDNRIERSNVTLGALYENYAPKLFGSQIKNSDVTVRSELYDARIGDSQVIVRPAQILGSGRWDLHTDPCSSLKLADVRGITVSCSGSDFELGKVHNSDRQTYFTSSVYLKGTDIRMTEITLALATLSAKSGTRVKKLEADCQTIGLGNDVHIEDLSTFEVEKEIYRNGSQFCSRNREITLGDSSVVRASKLSSFRSPLRVSLSESNLDVSLFVVQTGSAARKISGLNLNAHDAYFDVFSKDTALDFNPAKTYKVDAKSSEKDPIRIKSVKDFDQRYPSTSQPTP